MMRLLNVARGNTLVGYGVVSLLLVVTLALSAKTQRKRQEILHQKAEDGAVEWIEKSADHSLQILGNEDSPLKIVEARVKELSGAEFTRLTRRTTDLDAISSVPEVELTNTSGKTITGFVLAVREPVSRTTLTHYERKVSVAPGETYVVRREHFVSSDQKVITGDDGKTRQVAVQPNLDSEKYWIQFGRRPDVFITVGIVKFDDGSIVEDKGRRGSKMRKALVRLTIALALSLCIIYSFAPGKTYAYCGCGVDCGGCTAICDGCSFWQCLDQAMRCCEEAARVTPLQCGAN